ncbi:hypothetical protein BO71DRAFT_425161 [Aspergillus ellipticus CBS 707.79]|uniref:Cytochrome P450 n=1 Tax=Aspergillus ellipticus CBS 707.79 TaxID=1448320 RepID=A0A319DPE0_9EURO|nr:hypothetical protein BO71DRAFT_425161 [Aspergillus ellipticus CBS 707.79]
MSSVMFLLAKYPGKQELLRQEIDQLIAPSETLSYKALQKSFPFLDGCINEALRLFPAVPRTKSE